MSELEPTPLASPPALESFASNLYAAMDPLAWLDGTVGWSLAHFCAAQGVMFQDVEDLVRDTAEGPGWSVVMDVERCPDDWLPWLAQFVGVVIIPGSTPAQMRAQIIARLGWQRGTPAAIRAAAQATLTGSKTVYFRERSTNGADPPYTLEVVTLTNEVPPSDRGEPINVLTNPAGANATTGWSVSITGGAMTFAATNDPDFSGGGMQVNVTTPATGAVTTYFPYATDGTTQPNMRPVLPGEFYAVRARVKITRQWLNATNVLNLQLRCDNAAGTNATTLTVMSPSGSLQSQAVGTIIDLGGVVQIPANIAFAGPQVTSLTQVGATGAHVVGNFLMTKVASLTSPVPAYFDGDMAGYEWTGTAHASTSKAKTTTKVRDAILAQKPGGLVLIYNTVVGWDYTAMTTQAGTYANQTTQYATYNALALNQKVS